MHEYNAIYVHWCINYLTKLQAVDFLKKAKSRLKKTTKWCDQKEAGDSYIFLCDNLRPIVLPEQIIDGQRWRTREEMETLFRDAGLKIQH